MEDHQILFRGKDIETNELVYGAYVPHRVYVPQCDKTMDGYIITKDLTPHKVTYMGEYTGINMETGFCDPVFEGDIIAISYTSGNFSLNSDILFYVQFGLADYWAISVGNEPIPLGEGDTSDMCELFEVFHNVGSCCQIVGNTYENPEVLSRPMTCNVKSAHIF